MRQQEKRVRGRPSLAITHGHSKDHRPDLKQLLYILTVTEDGGVPVYFTSASGNTSDDKTHRQTWDLLRELVGHAHFLYVADCKLASSENLNYIARQQGRFITVFPDAQGRPTVPPAVVAAARRGGLAGTVHRDPGAAVPGESDFRDHRPRLRLLARAAQRGRVSLAVVPQYPESGARRAPANAPVTGATDELTELRDRLQSAKTRFTERKKVEQAVQAILASRQVESWLSIEIHERESASYRQAPRPSRQADELRQASQETVRSDLDLETVRLAEEEACDGIFPLITNVTEMTAEELLRAYKRQPIIEKRFSQLKTDFSVAPST